MYYIGVHKTKDPNDCYLGSGKYLKRAIQKYGQDSFIKDILLVTESREFAYEYEASLVTEERLASGETYNIKLGGQGGFDFINTEQSVQKRNLSEKYKKSVSKTGKLYNKIAFIAAQNADPNWERAKRNLLRNRHLSTGMLGKQHSSETKAIMSDMAKGTNNSQYGTMWITDGTINKKICKDNTIPEGWKKGRVKPKT